MAMEINQLVSFNYLHKEIYNISSNNINEKEWNCDLCQINTGSQNGLISHLQGKIHKAKEKKIRSMLCTRGPRSLSQTVTKSLTTFSTPIRVCEWLKPNFGWIKLNTDASVKNESVVLGGLLRDHMGQPICAFVSKASEKNVLLAELCAIWRGLILSLSLGVSAIWVESDCLSGVMAINKEVPYCQKTHVFLEHIWKLLLKFDKCHVTHSWREINSAADHLSKMVLEKSDVVLWPVDFPHKLWNIIKDDAEGKKYIRR